MSFGIRNMQHREVVLRQLRAALSSEVGSKVGILEFVNPQLDGTIGFLAGNFFIPYIIPVIGAIMSLGKGNEYTYLAKSIANFPTREEFLDMMTHVGFVDCESHNFLAGVVVLFLCEEK